MSLKTYLHRFDEARRDGKPDKKASQAKPKNKPVAAPTGPNGPLPSKTKAARAAASIPPGAKTISPELGEQPGPSDSAEAEHPQNRLRDDAGNASGPTPAPDEIYEADGDRLPSPESEFESFDTQFKRKTRKIVKSARPKGYEELKASLRVELLNVLNLAELDSMSLSEREMLVRQVVEDLPGLKDAPLNKRERAQIIRELMDEVFGFGPLEPLLSDPTITEILVNAHDKVYVERGGLLELSNVTFKDNEHVMLIANRIVGPLGRRIDDSSPMCDARLPDGSRVNIIIPPLATEGPCITIRRFTSMPTSINKLIEYGSIPPRLAMVLLACVKAKLNIIISGGTGTGKTTLLNVLSSAIPENERIITIEDVAELQLQQEHVVKLEARQANIEGKGEISLRQLVKNSLRMRPDRIIVGEVRSGEAFDMLQAMSTGHDGSLATVHANTPRDALSRIGMLILMADLNLPELAIRQYISRALDVVVQIRRLRDGSRKVVSLAEITGMEGEVISMQELFTFKEVGIDKSGKVIGHWRGSGVRANFMDGLDAAGIKLPPDIFSERVIQA